MAKVIKFPFKSTGRFDLKPVKKKRSDRLEEKGQLNIFDQANEDKEARVLSIDEGLNNFEAALLIHDTDAEKASELYRNAIEKNDHTSDAYCNLGILESQAGNESVAIDAFTKALENDPRHYEAHFNLANIYADAGNLKLAKLHYEIASKLDEQDPNLYYNLAIVLASLELYSQALETLHKYFERAGNLTDPDAEKFMILLENSVNQSSSYR